MSWDPPHRAATLPLGWARRRLGELAGPLLDARVAPGGVPLPPRRLRSRVGAPDATDFVVGGRRAAEGLAGVLAAAGLPALHRYPTVLDFGCGAGRVLPHVAALGARDGFGYCGCDVDAGALGWAARHHPELRFARNQAAPPLPWPPGSFELVYSISVFSHLDEPLQDRWLAELERVLAPGGIALLSVHGGSAFDRFRSSEVQTGWCPAAVFDRAPLDTDEFVFVPYVRSVWNRLELPGVSADYGLAFHGGGYVERRWSRWLELVSVHKRAISDWQDVVVCRKPATEAAAQAGG